MSRFEIRYEDGGDESNQYSNVKDIKIQTLVF